MRLKDVNWRYLILEGICPRCIKWDDVEMRLHPSGQYLPDGIHEFVICDRCTCKFHASAGGDSATFPRDIEQKCLEYDVRTNSGNRQERF